MYFQQNSNNMRSSEILINNGKIGVEIRNANTENSLGEMSQAIIVRLAANDKVKLQVWQNSGVSLNIGSGLWTGHKDPSLVISKLRS